MEDTVAKFSEKPSYFPFSPDSQTILMKLNEWRKINTFCDVIIQVDEFEFPAHSCVLASSSRFFNSFLDTSIENPWQFSQANPQIITIKYSLLDIIPKGKNFISNAMIALLNFMYTSNLEFDSDVLTYMMYFADIFQLETVKQILEEEAKKLPIVHGKEETMDLEEYIDIVVKEEIENENCKKFDKKENLKDLEAESRVDVTSEKRSSLLEEVKDFDMEGNILQINSYTDDEPFSNFISSLERRKPKLKKHLKVVGTSDDNLISYVQNKNISPFYENIVTIGKYKGAKGNFHKCVNCDLKFSHYMLALQHQTEHNGGLFICEFETCDFTTTKLKQFRDHLADHKLEQNKCNFKYCIFKAQNKVELTEHLFKHKGPKPHVCLTCDKQYKRKSDLKSHETTHTGEKLYHCETCGAGFGYKAVLFNHQLVHDTGGNKHLCDLCGFTAKRKQVLNDHYRKHTGNLLPCPEKSCSFKTHKPSLLRRHHRCIHLHEKNYMCQYCGSSFTSSASLKRHAIRKHPYQLCI